MAVGGFKGKGSPEFSLASDIDFTAIPKGIVVCPFSAGKIGGHPGNHQIGTRPQGEFQPQGYEKTVSRFGPGNFLTGNIVIGVIATH